MTATSSPPRSRFPDRSGQVAAVAAALTALAAAAAPVEAAPREGALTLSPSRAIGTAAPGVTIGPFELSNSTRAGFRTTAFPVMLGQNRDGGITARSDAASRRRAARLLEVAGRPGPLPPGGRIRVRGRLRRPTAARNFYGGIVARNEPTGTARETIRQAFQLNASILLRPPSGSWRVRLRAPRVRAEQDGRRKLRFVTPVRNLGNVDVPLDAELRLRRVGGDGVLLRRRMDLPMLLPGATVDLVARTGDVRLPAGRYEMVVNVHGRDEDLRVVGAFRLHGTNALATRDGKLESAEAPGATTGESLEVRASWHNRGNVAFEPRVVTDVRRIGKEGAGQRLARTELGSQPVEPGGRAELRGELPALDTGDYEVTVRLLDGRRELDRRTFSVSPRPAVSLWERLGDWLAAHPFLLPTLLLAAFAGLLAFFLRREHGLLARLAEVERRLDEREAAAARPVSPPRTPRSAATTSSGRPRRGGRT